MSRNFLALLVGIVSLVGCSEAPEPIVDEPVNDMAACGADKVVDNIGEPIASLMLPFGTDVRIIEDDGAMTMDFSPTRLNVVVDDRGLVKQVFCG